MRRLSLALLLAAFVAPGSALAQKPQAQNLDQLLEQVRTGLQKESEEMKKREAEFIRDRDKQKQTLANGRKKLADLEKAGEGLEKRFQSNELMLTDMETTLRTRLGTMGELFGVIRQVAGDTRAQIASSMISSQHDGRDAKLEALAESQSLPSIEDLAQLWYILQQEMTEAGKVTRYEALVVASSGEESKQEVVRVGPFTAVSNGKYLQWLAEVNKLAELGRQPPERYVDDAKRLLDAQEGSGFVRMAVDPSRGSILALLVETPSMSERLEFGGFIGYATISLGIFAGLVALLRFVMLAFVTFTIGRQLKRPSVIGKNPLGRILAVQRDNAGMDTDTLEKKLDEAIIRESAKIERFLWVVKIVAVSAPLLGLLGTVTGMIRTFQAITLFGTGDPKLMAGGISEALVTTMIGLFVAIPLVLMHAGLANMAKRLIDILEGQSAGVVAMEAERQKAASHGPVG